MQQANSFSSFRLLLFFGRVDLGPSRRSAAAGVHRRPIDQTVGPSAVDSDDHGDDEDGAEEEEVEVVEQEELRGRARGRQEEEVRVQRKGRYVSRDCLCKRKIN